MTSHRKRQTGVTLVEVLVSMLIMALGMVSLAALQAHTLSYQLGSAQRAQLSGLLADYAERVRANLLAAPGASGAPANAYQLTGTWTAQASSAVPVASKDCGGSTTATTTVNTCSSAELAAYDMAQWRAAVRTALPQGSVWVEGSALTGIKVTFMWADKDYGSGTVSAFTKTTATNCTGKETGVDGQTCCPENANVAAGVRCANFTVIP